MKNNSLICIVPNKAAKVKFGKIFTQCIEGVQSSNKLLKIFIEPTRKNRRLFNVMNITFEKKKKKEITYTKPENTTRNQIHHI